jgi:hypothetical protein
MSSDWPKTRTDPFTGHTNSWVKSIGNGGFEQVTFAPINLTPIAP